MAVGTVSKKESIAAFKAASKALPSVADASAVAPGKAVKFYVPMPKMSRRLLGPFKASFALPSVEEASKSKAALPGKALAFYVPMPKRSNRLVASFKASANLPTWQEATETRSTDSTKAVKFFVSTARPQPSKEFMTVSLPHVRKAGKKARAFWVPM